MTNALYDYGREGFLAGDIDWDGDNIKLIFVDEDDDVPDLANDLHLEDRLAASRVDISDNLSGKTVTDGIADATDITVTTVTGDEFESIDIFQDTAVESTSRLICNIDTATGLPCNPNGGDIEVQFDDAANKIFKL